MENALIKIGCLLLRKRLLKESRTFTYVTRLNLLPSQIEILDKMSSILSSLERQLFADFCRGKNLQKLKNEYLKKAKIPARYYNSIRIILEGKIKSLKEINKQLLKDKQQQLKSLKSKIYRLSKKIKDKVASNNEKRKIRLFNQKVVRRTTEIDKLKTDMKNDVVRLCFGGKKLFKKYKHLSENDYQNHNEWFHDFSFARNNSFYVVGSRDETAGNQLCSATVNDSGNINLKLRLPYFITNEKEDNCAPVIEKHLNIVDLQFNHGHQQIINGILENKTRNHFSKVAQKEKYPDKYKAHGSAISYRFLKDKKGYTIHVTLDRHVTPTIYSIKRGVVGVDINQDHLAIVNVSATGNLIKSFNIKYNLKHANKHQTKAMIGEVVKELCLYAAKVKKPIVIEDLDFTSKKKQMSAMKNVKRKFLLSAFAYGQITNNIQAKAFSLGIKVHKVNPAYTSIIGTIKYAGKDTSISRHQGAALVIARRHLDFKEKVPKQVSSIPTRYGTHVSFKPLVKMVSNNSCEPWFLVNKVYQTTARLYYLRMLAEQNKLVQQDNGREPPPCGVMTIDDEVPF